MWYTRFTHPLSYLDLVREASQNFAVPEAIVLAVIKNESGFQEDAVSAAGATGLMQIMPDTFTYLCSKRNLEAMDPVRLIEPDVNIEFGTYYLSLLFARFEDWDVTLAAYNAGQGRVGQWLKNEEYAKDGKLFYIPIEETRNYLKRVNDSITVYESLLASDH